MHACMHARMYIYIYISIYVVYTRIYCLNVDIQLKTVYLDSSRTSNYKWDIWLRRGHQIQTSIFGLELSIECNMG